MLDSFAAHFFLSRILRVRLFRGAVLVLTAILTANPNCFVHPLCSLSPKAWEHVRVGVSSVREIWFYRSGAHRKPSFWRESESEACRCMDYYGV